MEDKDKYLYAKFKMGHDPDIMENMIVSESRSTVDNWKSDRSRGNESGGEKQRSNDELFQKVCDDFETSINTFQVAVPFITNNISIMRRFHDDYRIRKFIAKQGEQLESGEFELYRLHMDRATAVIRRLQDSSAIGSGINRVPRLFIMGMVSAYDSFLSQLIRCMFVAKPEMLSSSERNISFKDLMEIGSVEEARQRMIEKEVESVIRDSHAQQIDWLEKKLGTPLRKDLKIWPEFIEICERRNLLSHTDGAVSSQYLAVCREHGVDVGGLSVGDNVKITAKYYRRAVTVMLEFGTKLAQVIWRKLLPAEIDKADQQLNGLAYGLITKRRYIEARTFLRFGLFEMKKHGEDATRKSMVVNLANAEKLGGNKEAAEQILVNEDWSAATDRYKICVAAVRDDVETVVRLMKSVVAAGFLQISDFQEWPVFEGVRSNRAFIETFEREFGRRIVVDRETSSPTKSPTGIDDEDGAADQAATETTIH